jgi:caa(3)-type oxidase subunit IV
MSDSHAPHTEAAHSPATQGEHGEQGHAAHDMHLGLYLGIGATLLVFTLITVWLSYVDFDKLFKGHGWNIIIAMIVATFKVCLVGAIFMHLKGETKTVWRFLYFTLFFVAGLFLLTLLHYADPIFGTGYNTH